MADPIRHSDVLTFLERAAQAATEADAATLENVRQRFLRAEAAWRALAESTERSERTRADEFARARAALKPVRDGTREAERLHQRGIAASPSAEQRADSGGDLSDARRRAG